MVDRYRRLRFPRNPSGRINRATRLRLHGRCRACSSRWIRTPVALPTLGMDRGSRRAAAYRPLRAHSGAATARHSSRPRHGEHPTDQHERERPPSRLYSFVNRRRAFPIGHLLLQNAYRFGVHQIGPGPFRFSGASLFKFPGLVWVQHTCKQLAPARSRRTPLCADLVPIGDPHTSQQYPIAILFCEICFTAHQRCQVQQTLFPPSRAWLRAHNGLAVWMRRRLWMSDATMVVCLISSVLQVRPRSVLSRQPCIARRAKRDRPPSTRSSRKLLLMQLRRSSASRIS